MYRCSVVDSICPEGVYFVTIVGFLFASAVLTDTSCRKPLGVILYT